MVNRLAIIAVIFCLTSITFACNEDSDCEKWFSCISGNSICPTEAPIQQNNNCVVPAGGQCNATLKCVDGATCDALRTCECNVDRYELDAIGLCLSLKNGPCQTMHDCAPNHGLECLRNGKCACASFGFLGSCFKGNGSPCNKTAECNQASGNGQLQCVKSTCSCPWGKVYKANKELYTPNTGYVFGKCKTPINQRCVCTTGTNYQCVTNRCGKNHRCGCGKGATYNSNTMECSCRNGEVYNEVHHVCVCHGKNFGHYACDCPGDLVPNNDTFSCRCTPEAMQVPDNKCRCRAPKQFNSFTKTCEY